MKHNLFKKKKITEADYLLLKSVTETLAGKYPYLLEQVSKDFIFDKEINRFGDEGTFTLTLNANLESRYANKKLPSLFIIQNIKIKGKLDKSVRSIELHILEGMLAGYRLNIKSEFVDLNTIDISDVNEKHFLNKTRKILENLLIGIDNSVLQNLDISSTFQITHNGIEYFVIKNMGDGNYLSINNMGEVFTMIHDPFSIIKVFENKSEFSNKMIENKMDFSSLIS